MEHLRKLSGCLAAERTMQQPLKISRISYTLEMCEPVNTIKFCSCKLSDGLPDKCWILHRYAGKKDVIVMGDPVLPDRYAGTYVEINSDILFQLNRGNCFDREMKLKNKDVL